MSNPKNFQAVLDWCEKHRPDLKPKIECWKDADSGVVLLLSVGFEAGRQFQHDNPDLPLDQPHLYLH